MTKKRVRTLIILAAVLLAVAAVFAVVKIVTREKPAEEEPAVKLISIGADEVDSLEYTFEGAKTTFERTQEGFVLKGEKDFPLDEAAVENMLFAICDAVSVRGFDEAQQLSQYGLDENALEVNLTVNGKKTTVLLGDHNAQTDTVYALVSGDNTVHMVASSVKEAFEYALSDIMSMDEVPKTGTVRKVSVKGTDADFTVEYIEDSEGMYFTGTSNYFMDGKALDNDAAGRYFTKVKQLAPSACYMWSPGEEAKSKCGFDEPVTVTVEGEMSAENEEGKTKTQVNFFIGDVFEDEEGAYYRYMMFDGSDMIYLTEEYILNAVLYPDKDALLPARVAEISMYDIVSAKITANGKKHDMVIDHAEQKTMLDGEQESYVFTQGFFVDLKELKWEKLLKEKPELTNNIRFSAQMRLKNGEEVSVTAFEYDENFCLVKVSHREELMLVSIRDVEFIEDSWEKMLENMSR